ncbi:4'-phosphopantetheinyl transferase superfamily [Irpex lacteus]|nr:4'-phosphopantetheinyl transferase superfamily [Irpex lacteus]
MQVCAVLFDVSDIDKYRELYQQALPILDQTSREQVEKYYHFIDSFRGLVGRLLIRQLLSDHGVPLQAMTFASTPARKPYITTRDLHEPIGYNITHDNGVVAMAYASGSELYPDPPAYRVGIDVMLLQLPRRITYAEFVESVSDQLTPYERGILEPQKPIEQEEALRRFYLIWTLKEAYTKALGLGLGFDFSRIEYDVLQDVVRIDNVIPQGWEFIRFDLQRGDDAYVGVVAQYVGEDKTATGDCVVEHRELGDWIKVYDPTTFMQRAINTLKR